jgi:hypothetical protein
MSFLKFGFYATLFAMALFVTSCGAEATSDQSDHIEIELEEGHDDHEHEEGHDHDSHEANDSSSVDMDSPEYASAYICPMYCKGSGSDAEGKCPKCGMDYVKNENN